MSTNYFTTKINESVTIRMGEGLAALKPVTIGEVYNNIFIFRL